MSGLPPIPFLRGFPEGRAPEIALRAGSLRVLFDPSRGSLRAIRAGRVEALRGIYAAVRDRNWGTMPPRISGLRVEERPAGFRIEFDASIREGEIDFAWRGKVEGRPEGVLTFEFDGIARSSFLRNRIGLCILHPAACAGTACSVEHAGGSVEDVKFPLLIAPRQPFRGIRAIVHETEPGVRVEVRLEGETFEMEDQRNWTDASFKTYGTPLDLPFPVRVEAGARVRQVAVVRVSGTPRETAGAARGDGAIEIAVGEREAPLPPVGLGLASHGRPLSARAVALLRLLRLSHLRVDLRLGESVWSADLERSAREASALGARLHAALHLSGDPGRELDDLAATAGRLRPPIDLWMVFRSGEKATGERTVALARERLGPLGPDVPIAAGADAYFAELNRGRPSAGSTALPCFSLNPQVHASDNATLVENLEAQSMAVGTAASFSPHPVVVSPITLRPRSNPDATGPAPPVPPGELPPQVDPLQMSLFCAGWTAGSIAALAGTGRVHSLTYFETTGPRGVMETDEGSPEPERFPSAPGAPFPVFHALSWLAGFDRVLEARSSDPSAVQVLALAGPDGRRRLIVANVTEASLKVLVRSPAPRARVLLLDETSAAAALFEPERFLALEGAKIRAEAGSIPLDLGPCALARIDPFES
jgi:hypothetical protein